MNILGIDYGRRKVGLAIAVGFLAEPWKVIRYKDTRILSDKLKEIVKKDEIKKVIVGISEGEMGEESRKFSLNLSRSLNIPVETFDETLSTKEAQRLGIEAGIKRSKRRGFEDAFAAAVMLQNYLDQTL